MATSNLWAMVSGATVVAVGIAGALAWRQTHVHPAPPSVALIAPPAGPKAATAPPVAPGPADRGPEPPSAPDPEALKAEAPTFDVVRVEPSGDAVVAGKGQPGADVALMASGQVVAQAKADDNGQFVMTPPPLKPGSYDLSLRQTRPGRAIQRSAQAVAVAIPEGGKGQVVVALAEPGKPTKLLSTPVASARVPPEPEGAAAAPPQLSIRTVELENGSGFFATGTAPPGSRIHVYLNDSHLTDVTASATGDWTLRIGKGLTGGRYEVRADAVGAGGSSVVARSEVPFDVPVALAQAPSPAAPQPASLAVSATPAPAAPISNAVVAAVETARVVAGDNLWDISRSRLGNGTRYTQIYTANVGQIRDPDLIYPGQVFVVPR